MKKIFIISIILSLLKIITSCCKPGTGGEATIVAFPQHHGRSIINHMGYPDTVYVKFNAKDLPGTKPSDYNTYFIGEGREDHVHLKGLHCGSYYLYAVGYDSSINQRVTGGIAIKISHKDRKHEIDLNVPVTE